MANPSSQDPTADRRDVMKDSSLSGSSLRDNLVTEQGQHRRAQESSDADSIEEVVDQDPGERQKENQNQSKDDPLAA